MKKSPMQRHTPLQAKTPMKRGGPLLRTAWKRKQRRVSAQAKREYEAGVDAYRDPDGFARCADCGRGLLDREIHRHHVVFRSQGGKTVRANILPLCERCHGKRHGLRFSTERSARSFSGGGSFGVALSSESQARGLPSRE